MLIIVKGSGYDARKRVVRMQRDLISKVVDTDSKDRKDEGLKDFQQVSKEGGLYEPSKHTERKISLSYDSKNKKIIERGDGK